MRPFTTVFWSVVYPAVFYYMIKANIVCIDSFEVLSLFSQEVIGLILGFWYTGWDCEKVGLKSAVKSTISYSGIRSVKSLVLLVFLHFGQDLCLASSMADEWIFFRLSFDVF
ncbi:hypothetical protein [Candidatus Liberibacter sp.]|uniref:hypothetical protein n=1 Tax=Candidatus Liberibacter sp. TaxID=34022 RepID=UPI0015F4025B|nr:hypothetical protein [Candidatus Liberibacter sp.]MBA5723666.1 hypothetical protein [Candidatus Liberibacter sp.]